MVVTASCAATSSEAGSSTLRLGRALGSRHASRGVSFRREARIVPFLPALVVFRVRPKARFVAVIVVLKSVSPGVHEAAVAAGPRAHFRRVDEETRAVR